MTLDMRPGGARGARDEGLAKPAARARALPTVRKPVAFDGERLATRGACARRAGSMSRPLPAAVPPAVRALLDADPGDPLADGVTLLLLTVRDDGWSHQAMISVGEVVAVGEDALRLAVWPGSTSTHNLRERRRATLTAVIDGVAYTLFLAVEPCGELETPLAGKLDRFDARVRAASADEAPYATLESGVRFRLKDRDSVLARWREAREELRR